MGNTPNSFVTATTNQYLTPSFIDVVLRNNFFFGELLRNTRTFKGSQVLQPLKVNKGVASVAFSGFDVLPITQIPQFVNMVFYPSFKKLTELVKSVLIYGETPNCAFA